MGEKMSVIRPGRRLGLSLSTLLVRPTPALTPARLGRRVQRLRDAGVIAVLTFKTTLSAIGRSEEPGVYRQLIGADLRCTFLGAIARPIRHVPALARGVYIIEGGSPSDPTPALAGPADRNHVRHTRQQEQAKGGTRQRETSVDGDVLFANVSRQLLCIGGNHLNLERVVDPQ